jgi:hypothetical protein
MKKNAIPIMKVNALEAHDRLLHIKNSLADTLAQGCEDCLKKNPLSLAIQSKCPYVYIFAHPRKKDDGSGERMLWQPRLSRPKPQTNSYLFRAQSNSDLIEICWMIPPREQWEQYKQDKICHNEIVEWSIYEFQHRREDLDREHPDDLPDVRAKAIMKQIIEDFISLKQKRNILHDQQQI